MKKVHIIESSDKIYQSIVSKLRSSDKSYQFQQISSFTSDKLKTSDFDILLVSQTYQRQSAIEVLQEVVISNFGKPIFFLAQTDDEKIEKITLEIGADDYLSFHEVTAKLFHKSVKHCIEKKHSSQELSRLATHDQLTGLANRYLLHEHLEHAVKMAKRSQDQFSVFFIDLDRFKIINESLGYEVGDLLLIEIAKRLQSCVREADIMARLGNDEFAILLLNTCVSRDLALVAEKIQSSMESSLSIKSNELFITMSIGIATYPECGHTPEELLKNADVALYKAKEQGRNQYYFFTKGLNKVARFKLELEKNLRRAIINGEFEIHLQPQISSKTGCLIGAEALLRWHHPKYGYISPVLFIPLLDELGLIVGIESWVLKKVCTVAQNFALLHPSHSDIKYSVNISGTHFKTGDLKENVYTALQASSLNARNLEIELTEDIMIEHVEHNSNLLSELKALGVSIALDDFGKGYSSLSYLKNFPADILKIDKAFIDHINTNDRDSAIVEAMISLSHKLGIKVVAEGVEEKDQLSQLIRYGCDYIQGYYFSKPMNVENFESFIVNNKSQQLLN